MRLIRITYAVYTEESVANGEADRQGWIEEEGIPLANAGEAIEYLKDRGPLHPSASEFYPGVWYTQSGGAVSVQGASETVEYGYHLAGGWTEFEKARIYQGLSRAGMLL